MSIYQYFILLTNINHSPRIFFSSDRHIPEEQVTPVILYVEQQREHDSQVHKTDEHHNLEIVMIGRIDLLEISHQHSCVTCTLFTFKFHFD